MNVPPNVSPKTDFFELNPHYEVMHPYSKAKEEPNGSGMMWSAYFMTEPDRKKNSFAEMGKEEASKRLIKAGFVTKEELESDLFKEIYESMPEDSLTAAQHALRAEIESLKLRTHIFEALQAGIKQSLHDDPDDKRILLLNKLQSDAPKIYDNYEKIKDKFLDEKESAKRRGSSKEMSLGE